MNKLARLWNQFWRSKTTATVTLATLPPLLLAFIAWLFPTFKTWLDECAAWLVKTADTPHWLLISLGLSAAIFIGWLLKNNTGRDREIKAEAAARAYKEGEFFGVVWRWETEDDGESFQFWTFCPACDLQLPQTYARDDPKNIKLQFRCRDCEITTVTNYSSQPDLNLAVALKVQQHIRKLSNGRVAAIYKATRGPYRG